MLAKRSVQARTDAKGEVRWQEEGRLGEKADLSVAASYEHVEKIVLQTSII